MSEPEEAFAFQLRALRIPYQREVRFDAKRRWRLDFVLGSNVAVEIDGGTFSGGRHTTGTGFQADCDKANAAVLAGYRLFRVTPAMVESGAALQLVEAALR